MGVFSLFPEKNPGRLTIDFVSGLGVVVEESLRSNKMFTKATDFRVVYKS